MVLALWRVFPARPALDVDADPALCRPAGGSRCASGWTLGTAEGPVLSLEVVACRKAFMAVPFMADLRQEPGCSRPGATWG